MDKRAEGADARYEYHVPCAHCGEFHAITWGGKDEPHGFKWVNDDPETVRHLCPHCGALQTQTEYLAAAERGYWEGDDGSTIDRDGVFRARDGSVMRAHRRVAFRVWTGYSPMVSWSSIVRQFIEAYRKAQAGDESPLRTFWNTTLGRAWEGEIDKIETDELKRRAELEEFRLPGNGQNLVPRDCLLLLAGADTQDNRIEVGVWGFGRGGEMWTIDHRHFFGNPAEDKVWDELDAFLADTRYQHECGQQMSVYAMAIDSGGHHSNAVYNFARRRKSRRVYAVRGRPFGEKAIKDGAGHVDIDWRGRKAKKGVILWHVGTNLAKDLLHGRLQVEQPGQGYVHLSHELSDEWFRQFAGEVRANRRTATGTRSLWVPIRKRVEALDCTVYALWLEEHLGLPRKSDAWWEAMAEKLNAVEAEGAPPDPAPTPKQQRTEPAEAGSSVSEPRVESRKVKRAAPKPRVVHSSYLRSRR